VRNHPAGFFAKFGDRLVAGVGGPMSRDPQQEELSK